MLFTKIKYLFFLNTTKFIEWQLIIKRIEENRRENLIFKIKLPTKNKNIVSKKLLIYYLKIYQQTDKI
jgi:hypothetical protein